MKFLERFSEADRDRLLAAGQVKTFRAGEYLMHRGEKGGDVFLVERGTLEVVDNRSQPEVVLATPQAGDVIGEMAFLDASPRSADVRATDETEVRVWEQDMLAKALEADARLAAAFYRALVGVTVDRARRTTAGAVAGTLGRQQESATDIARSTAAAAHQLVADVSGAWLEAEARLRKDVGDETALADMERGFDGLVHQMSQWFAQLTDLKEQEDAGQVLKLELHPYLNRARTSVLAADRAIDARARADLMAHLVGNHAAGDGALGEVLDRGLLALPTALAYRRRTDEAVDRIKGVDPSPEGETFRCMVINTACGALIARLVAEFARLGNVQLTCVDGSREALATFDAGLGSRPASVDVRLIQDELVGLSLGHSQYHHPSQDLIVIDGLVEYLPDRLVATLFDWCSQMLRPGGYLVVTTLGPSNDESVFSYLLGWPSNRREVSSVVRLLKGADIEEVKGAAGMDDGVPSIVVVGRRTKEGVASEAGAV